MGFYSFFGITEPFDPDFTLVTSNVVSPMVLGVFRLVIAVYALAVIITIMVWEGVKTHDLHSYFSYFTNLCYIGLCAYFWASSVQTLAFASNFRRRATDTRQRVVSYPLQHWPKILQLLHVFLNCTVYVFPFLVTIVYWALLSAGSFDTTYTTWKNLSVHALNSATAIIEILLSRSVPRWANIPIIILLLGGYLGIAYITHATQGFYTYSFLNPQKEGAKLAAYIVGIPVAALIILVIIKGVIWARDRVLGSKKRRAAQEDEYALREKAVQV